MAHRRRTRQTSPPAPSNVAAAPGGNPAPNAPPSLDRKRNRRRWIRLIVGLLLLAGLFSLRRVWWPPAFRSLAASELRQGHIEEGLAWLEYVDWLAPDDLETTLLRVRAARKQGQNRQVEELLDLAAKQGATLEQLQRERILAYAQAGQLSQAEPHLARLLSDPQEDLDDVCEAYVLGFMRAQRFSEANQIIDAWIKDSPDLATPHVFRAGIQTFRQEEGEAIESYRRALELDPDRDDARIGLAESLAGNNQFAEAIREYEACLDSSEHRTGALVGIALCHKTLGEVGLAQEKLREALRETPRDALVLMELGRLLFEIGEYADAVSILEKGVEIVPQNHEMHYLLAQSLSLDGREDDAEEHFAFVAQAREAMGELLELNTQLLGDPTNAELLVATGRIYMEYGQESEGAIRLHIALDVEPGNEEALRLLGECYARLAETDPSFQRLADEYRQAEQPGG